MLWWFARKQPRSDITSPGPASGIAWREQPRLLTTKAGPTLRKSGTVLCLSTVTDHAPTLVLAFILYRTQRDVNIYSQAHESRVQGLRGNPRKGGAKSETTPNLIELNPQLLRTTCYPTIMIHLLHDHQDSPVIH
ncbi:hypothetical protein PO909_013402 [Leuciscus waleckii]